MGSRFYVALALVGLALSGGCKGSAEGSFTGKELKPVEGSVGGIAFSISLPEGLPKNEALSSDTLVAWEARPAGSLTISVAKLALPPATLKDAVARNGGSSVISKQEAIEGGFLVSGHSNNKELARVDVYKTASEGALWCNATASDPARIDEARGWLERVCLSMAARGGTPAPAGSNAPAAGKQVDLLPEMKSFIGGFGSRAKVTEALREHGAPDLDAKDMATHDLTEPKVLKAELHGAKLCYTMEAKAGAGTRAYLVCWDKDKIVSIESLGAR
ncbi:MAG TPA: hypothetical protein VK459_00480 [Polyangiaceae bacterium]|jgi:hypothetical protein|nr:hypothetical protein [Polyangiaceae bacterium]